MSWFAVLFIVEIVALLVAMALPSITEMSDFDGGAFRITAGFIIGLCVLTSVGVRCEQIADGAKVFKNCVVLKNTSSDVVVRHLVERQTMMTSGVETVVLYPGECVCLQAMTGGFRVLDTNSVGDSI